MRFATNRWSFILERNAKRSLRSWACRMTMPCSDSTRRRRKGRRGGPSLPVYEIGEHTCRGTTSSGSRQWPAICSTNWAALAPFHGRGPEDWKTHREFVRAPREKWNRRRANEQPLCVHRGMPALRNDLAPAYGQRTSRNSDHARDPLDSSIYQEALGRKARRGDSGTDCPTI